MSFPAKRGYHHGDLRNALIAAAAQLAEEGGPQAVTVRAAAKTAGVTPTAAYRHFENHEQLLSAVKDRALEALATAVRQRVDALPHRDDVIRHVMNTLCALGRGYIDFAITEPGMFRTAFEQGGSAVDVQALATMDSAFQILAHGLDQLVEAGHLVAEARPLAEVTPWSAVHGLSMLVLDGPLQGTPPDVLEPMIERMLAILIRGLSSKDVDDQLIADVLTDTRRV